MVPGADPVTAFFFFTLARGMVRYRSMHSRAVIHALKGEEFVDRGDGVRILRGDHDFGAPRQIAFAVSDLGSKRLHCRGAGHVGHGVDETWEREISIRECGCDRSHVRADGRFADRVSLFSLEHDSSANRQGLEDVRRCVLVHTHRGLAPLLKGRKTGVGASRLLARRARDQSADRDHRTRPGAHGQCGVMTRAGLSCFEEAPSEGRSDIKRAVKRWPSESRSTSSAIASTAWTSELRVPSMPNPPFAKAASAANRAARLAPN